MKRRLVLAKLFLLQSVVWAGCADNEVPQADSQEVYFEVTYSNSAWTRQFKGFLIGSDGSIRTYDSPEKWNNVTRGVSISASQMQENLAQTKVSGKSVTGPELTENIARIGKISGETFTKPAQVGADQGLTMFYAYRYDAEKGLYTPVLLDQTGDQVTHNVDASAIQIADWLKTVISKVY